MVVEVEGVEVEGAEGEEVEVMGAGAEAERLEGEGREGGVVAGRKEGRISQTSKSKT